MLSPSAQRPPSPRRSINFLCHGSLATSSVCSADQRISGSAVDGAPTEEPRPDANKARRQRPAPEGNWRVPCSCLLCWDTRGCPQMFQHVPRSSILCGCINRFLYRQVNAVWGRYPTACTMYITKKVGVCWGLVDKISPAFELRNSGVPCRQSPGHPSCGLVCCWCLLVVYLRV